MDNRVWSSDSHTVTHFLAKIFSDHLLDLLHGALRGFAVQHLQRRGVLFRQQVIQSTEVLANLDEGSPVGTAQVPQTLRRSQVHLKEDPHSFSPNEEPWIKAEVLVKKKYYFFNVDLSCIFQRDTCAELDRSKACSSLFVIAALSSPKLKSTSREDPSTRFTDSNDCIGLIGSETVRQNPTWLRTREIKENVKKVVVVFFFKVALKSNFHKYAKNIPFTNGVAVKTIVLHLTHSLSMCVCVWGGGVPVEAADSDNAQRATLLGVQIKSREIGSL